MNLSNFQESLLVVSAMKSVLENDLRIVKRYINDDDLKFSICNKMIVDICSFLEEWKRFGGYAKSDELIKESMRITAPAIKRIKMWKGMEGMRNSMLAHGFRDMNRSGRLTSLEMRYFKADVPTSYAEIFLLAEYCVYVISTFLCRHSDDHKFALSTISIVSAEDVVDVRGIGTMKEFDAAVLELQEHMFKLDPKLKECFGV